MDFGSHRRVQTSEAERIGVDQVAKILPTGSASGSNQRKALSVLRCDPLMI